MRDYLSIDRQDDVLASLNSFIDSLGSLARSELSWKYAIVSIHSALQGCMCIALRNGNSFQTWKDRQFKKWYEAYNSGKEGLDMPNTPQLDYFMELFDKCFTRTDVVDREKINWLNETRNNLVHFNTDSYAIRLDSITESCLEALNAISKTPAVSQGIFFYEEDQKSIFESRLAEANRLLNEEINKAAGTENQPK